MVHSSPVSQVQEAIEVCPLPIYVLCSSGWIVMIVQFCSTACIKYIDRKWAHLNSLLQLRHRRIMYHWFQLLNLIALVKL